MEMLQVTGAKVQSTPALGDLIILPHGGSLVEQNQFLRVCFEYMIALVVDIFVVICISLEETEGKKKLTED